MSGVQVTAGQLSVADAPGEEAQGDTPLTRLVRLRRWVVLALRDIGYCAAVCVWGVVCFAVLVAGVTVTMTLLLLIVGLAVWVGFVHVARWTTSVDRRLASWQRHRVITASYRSPRARGVFPYLRTMTSDPQTWRDLAWLAATSVIGFALGLLVITAVGLAVAYLTMPLWFWAVSDPAPEYGITNLGVFTVDTLAAASAATALGAIAVPFVLLLARGSACLHAALASWFLMPAQPGLTSRDGNPHA